MTDTTEGRKEPAVRPRRLAEHMANERTYLAWLRTSVALMSFGLVLNRFAVEMGSVRRLTGRPAHPSVLILPTEQVGAGMVVARMILILGAALRYAQIRRGIDTGEYRPLVRVAWIIALAVLVGGVTCLVWIYPGAAIAR